ncbi:MAG TPA: phage tail assembly chaperone [Mesorhizobium sp.]|jgi:uncharacterized phage protein (TIGR02216 family)|nr:phage tail assembly chaperone [Mesorhizobium sp.]
MALGFGVLRLSPEAFWRMTPRELERALSVLMPPAAARPTKAGLEDMMRMFPD